MTIHELVAIWALLAVATLAGAVGVVLLQSAGVLVLTLALAWTGGLVTRQLYDIRRGDA